MTFPVQTIANKKYQFNNILVSDILEIAKIPQNRNEQQIKHILATILGGSDDVDALTAQERYAIYLSYLNLVDNSLDESIVIADYLAQDLNNFSRERVSENSVSVRHLGGMEAEALEIGCEYTEDWHLGAMAITIGCEYLPEIDVSASSNVGFIGKMIQNRIETLKRLSLPEFNALMRQYLSLQDQLPKLVNFVFEDGIVLEKFNGGADDAPVRFRASAAIHGYGKELLSIAIASNSTI